MTFKTIWQRKIFEVIRYRCIKAYDSKHLLTDCVVSAEQYPDRSSDLLTERSEMQIKCKTSRLNLQGNADRSKYEPPRLHISHGHITRLRRVVLSFVFVATRRASAEEVWSYDKGGYHAKDEHACPLSIFLLLFRCFIEECSVPKNVKKKEVP